MPSAAPTGNSWRALANTRSSGIRKHGGAVPAATQLRAFQREGPGSNCGTARVLRRRRHLLLANCYREGAFVARSRHLAGRRRDHLAAGPARAHGAVGADPRRPHGGIKVRSPVEDWMLAEDRRSIRREETRPDQPRPTFMEDGYTIFNRYRPPAHPAGGGEIEAFKEFFAHLAPTGRNGTGCGTGWRTKRAGHGCRWSRG